MKPSDAKHDSSAESSNAPAPSGESAWADFQRALTQAKDQLKVERQHIDSKLTAGHKPGGKRSKQAPPTGRDPELAGMIERLVQHYDDLITSLEQRTDVLRQTAAGQESVAKQQATLEQLRQQLDEKVKLIEANSAKELQRAETISRLQTEMDHLAEQQRAAAAKSEESLAQKDRQISQHIQALRIREEQLRQNVQRADDLQREVDRLRQERDRLARKLAALQAPSGTSPIDPALPPTGDSFEPADIAFGLTDEAGPLPAGRLRLAGPIAVILALATVALAAGVWMTHRPRYDVAGMVHVTPPDPAVISTCEKIAWQPGVVPADKNWRTPVDVERGILFLHLEVSTPGAGVEQVNKVGRAILEQVQPGRQASSTQSAGDVAEMDRLRLQIEDLGRQLAAATQPSTSPAASSSEVEQSYRTRAAQRRQIADSIAQLGERITREPPSDSAINLDPTQLKNAEGDVKQLQADMVALNQRKQRLTELLRELVNTEVQRIGVFMTHSTQGTEAIADAAKGHYEADVIQKLLGMGENLESWRQNAEKLRELCNTQAGLLKNAEGGLDPLAVQAALEQGAKACLEAAGQAETALRQKLQAIGQGGEEPVKRSVLQRNIAQRLQPLLEAGSGVRTGAQALTVAGNAQLDAVTRTVASLQARAAEQRRGLESDLRQQALAQARARFKQEVQEAVAARDRLLERDRDLQTEMGELATQAMAELDSHQQYRRLLEERQELYKRQSFLVSEYLAQTTPHSTTTAARISYIPAVATMVSDPLSARLIRAFTLGMGPLIAGMLLLVFIQGWRNRRASRLLQSYAGEPPDADFPRDERSPFNGT